MSKPGIILAAEPGHRRAAIIAARELERRGFPHLLCPYDYGLPEGEWISNITEAYDALSLSTAILQATHAIHVGTGITVTYMRHPADVAAAASFNHEISNGRFTLGLGSGVDEFLLRFGVQPERPLAHMRSYVERLRASASRQPLPPILIAAVRPRMIRLACEIADGPLGANWALSSMPAILEAIPAERRGHVTVGNVAPAWITDDRGEGLAFMRRFLGLHMRLANFRSYFAEAGYESEAARALAAIEAGDDAGVEAAISERMADDIGIFGTRSQIRDKVEAWQAQGVTLTISTLLTIKNQPEAVLRASELFD